MAGHSRTLSPDSWQDEVDFAQRPPTSSTSDHSEHSFHSRSKSSAHITSPKRLSIFSRARSNTANLTSTTNRQLPTVPLSYGEPSVYPMPTDEKASDNATRSLLVRGSRILRRQGSKLNVAAPLEEEDELGKSAVRFEVSNLFHRTPKLKKNDSQDHLKQLISEPYNFHHLTHTSSSQFHALDNSSNVELVDEFSAIQASQIPEPELKGIRAQNLHSSNALTGNSNESVSDYNSQDQTSPLARSPPLSPKSTGRIENFSRPVTRVNKPLPPSPSILPPPRVSSRQAYSEIPEPTSQAIDELLGVNAQPTIADYDYPQLDNHHFRRSSSLERIDLAGMMQQYNLHHAMTSAQYDNRDDNHRSGDDIKLTATNLINSYLSDLEDVPEEDETKDIASRNSRAFSVRAKEKNLVINASRSSAGPSHGSVVVVQDPQLSFKDDLMSPTLPQSQAMMQESPMSQASHNRRRSSTGCMNFAMTWDEDIDFCYEHEAEADCDFDWHRPSLDNSRQSNSDVTTSSKAAPAPKHLSSHYLQVNAASMPATPELDPGSAHSVLTGSHEALTPLTDGAAHADFLTPNVSGHEYHERLQTNDAENETVYENFLATGDDPDDQFQYYPQTTSHPIDGSVSPRSSVSAISKCNSQENLMLSRAGSIARKHRSSISTTSVPDLINSSNSSRENTIRESVESLENPTFLSPPENVRPTFSIHRPVKSLGSELSTLSELRTTGSDGSIHVVDIPYHFASAHDRTKSTSAIDHDESHMSRQSAQGLPFAARQSLAAQRRKSRAGYSLFPAA